jgi:polysaccharide biosynthesis protein PslF
VDDLLAALRLLVNRERDVRLVMIGGRDHDSNAEDRRCQQRVDALIGELGLCERVIWTGFTDSAEVSGHLLSADICVLPFRDGATFQRGTLLAALAHGLPVVTTRVPGGQPRGAP